MKKQTFKDFDKRGVRPFVTYAAATGKYGVECYRKEKEPRSDADWKMIRVGHVQSYNTRDEAEVQALQLAQHICEQYNY